NSTWASFFRRKYTINGEPRLRNGDSIIWKQMKGLLATVDANTTWSLGKGEMSFWFDNWTGEGRFSELLNLECMQQIKVKNAVVNNNNCNWQQLEHDIPTHWKQTLSHKFFLNEDDDAPLWGPSEKGDFTIKSAWNFWLREEELHDRMKWIWHHIISTKIQIFSWKAWKKIITVDELIQQRIPLVSRCCCCNIGITETLNHLLVQGEMAATVWAHFGNVCGVRQGENDSWGTRQGLWFQTVDTRTQMGIVRGVLPTFIIWEVWKARCAYRFEDKSISPSIIIRTINKDLLEIMFKLEIDENVDDFKDIVGGPIGFAIWHKKYCVNGFLFVINEYEATKQYQNSGVNTSSVKTFQTSSKDKNPLDERNNLGHVKASLAPEFVPREDWVKFVDYYNSEKFIVYVYVIRTYPCAKSKMNKENWVKLIAQCTFGKTSMPITRHKLVEERGVTDKEIGRVEVCIPAYTKKDKTIQCLDVIKFGKEVKYGIREVKERFGYTNQICWKHPGKVVSPTDNLHSQQAISSSQLEQE
ncbi:hypothetical protein GIB67_018884, partial [Kingdonia uniflora]